MAEDVAVAICTNEDCKYGDVNGVRCEGVPTYAIFDCDPRDKAMFGIEPNETPQFCKFCGEAFIRFCPRCDRPIRMSEIWTRFCSGCGDQLRFKPKKKRSTV